MHARFGRALAYRLSALSTRRYTVSLAATSEAIMKAITRGNQIGTHQPQSRAIREALRAARTSSRADTEPRAVMSRWMVRAWPRVTAKWSGVWCDRSRHSTWAFASSNALTCNQGHSGRPSRAIRGNHVTLDVGLRLEQRHSRTTPPPSSSVLWRLPN